MSMLLAETGIDCPRATSDASEFGGIRKPQFAQWLRCTPPDAEPAIPIFNVADAVDYGLTV